MAAGAVRSGAHGPAAGRRGDSYYYYYYYYFIIILLLLLFYYYYYYSNKFIITTTIVIGRRCEAYERPGFFFCISSSTTCLYLMILNRPVAGNGQAKPSQMVGKEDIIIMMTMITIILYL